MRRIIPFVAIILSFVLSMPADSDVPFERLNPEDLVLDGRKVNIPLASATVEGGTYCLFLLQGPKLADLDSRILYKLGPGGVKSRRGEYRVRMEGMKAIPGAVVSVTREDSGKRIRITWNRHSLSFTMTGTVAAPEPRQVAPPQPEAAAKQIEKKDGGLRMGKIRTLAHGVSWRPPEKLKSADPPEVSLVTGVASPLKGFKLMGPVYRIQWSKKNHLPMEVSFPLPDIPQEKLERVVMLKMEKRRTTVVPVWNLDRENRRLAVRTTSFSDWGVAVAEGSGAATISGQLHYEDGYDETPGYIVIHLDCHRNASGEYSTLLIHADGPGPCAHVTPIPPDLYGVYAIKQVFGCSASHFYTAPRPYPEWDIRGAGAYTFELDIVPTTSNLEGKVTDRDGNPLERVRVEIESPDGNTYYTTSHGGGRYIIDRIGLGGEPVRKKVVSAPYTLINQEEEKCNTSGGRLELEAGMNMRRDFVLQPEGTVTGHGEDKEGEPHRNAPVDVVAEDGSQLHSRTDGDGNYRVEHVPAGSAVVTLHCPDPDSKVRESKEVEVECDAEVRADFAFDCCEAGLRLLVDDSEGDYVVGARVRMTDSGNQVFSGATNEMGEFEVEKCAEGPASLTVICPGGEDRKEVNLELDCKEVTEHTMVLECCRQVELTGTITVKRGMPGTMFARLDGKFELASTGGCGLKGEGKGEFAIEVTGADGGCTGKQAVELKISGRRKGKFLLLDITYDDKGVPMAWKCGSGKAVPIPAAFKSFEDEGRELRIPITSEDLQPLRAELKQGGGPSPFGTTMEVKIRDK